MYQPNWVIYTQFQLFFLLGALYISLECQTTYEEMRCSTLELEEDDTKGTSVHCRLREYMTYASELQEIIMMVYILTGEFKLQTRQM
jgi:hypothetical protein